MTLPASDSRILLRLGALATICALLFAVHTHGARQAGEGARTRDLIERIEFVGSRRIEAAFMRDHIRSRPGDPFSFDRVERDAQALRDTGFFDDVRPKVENSPDQPNAKIVAFYVNEKPIIRRIEYRGIRSISESDLLAAFRNNKVELSVESWFDQAKLNRAAAVIRDLLAARGYESATVKSSYEQIPAANAVTITFDIDEGPKI